jgi:hypothetical protein
MKSPVYDTLMRLVIGLRRWYVQWRPDLTVDEEAEARAAIEGLAKVAEELQKREKYGR